MALEKAARHVNCASPVMEFLSQTYVALRGPTGVIQTPEDIIARLSDRLSPATLLADRRAAVLALKGLVRDCKQDVGDRALTGLLEVLSNDAEVDADIGKAVLETLDLLCDAEDSTPGSKESGLKHTNQVLANEKAINTLFSLLGDLTFYTRFASLQLLSTLLRNRRQTVQGYFLKTSTGPASVISVLEDKREIIRGGESIQGLLHGINSGFVQKGSRQFNYLYIKMRTYKRCWLLKALLRNSSISSRRRAAQKAAWLPKVHYHA